MPDDPRDTSTPEDRAPSSPWAARRSLPSVDDLPAGPEAKPEPDVAAPRVRSIFNRFRRGRATPEDLQSRLMFPEEPSAATGTEETPALAPARPLRRPASEDAATTPIPGAPLTISPLPPMAAAPSRPTPPVETTLPAEAVAAPPSAEPAPQLMATPVVMPEVASDVTLNEANPWAPPPPRPSPPPVETRDDVSARVAEVDAPLAAAAGIVLSPAELPAEVPPTPSPAPPPSAATSRFTMFERRDRPVEPAAVIAAGEHEPTRLRITFRPVPVPVSPYMLLLTALVTLVTLAYLLVEPSPRWFLILGAAAVAAGMDGTLRATWRVTYAGRETTPALFMPAIFILAVPPLIEHNVRGLGVIPAGLATGLAFFVLVAGQVGSARPGATYFAWARTASTAGAYAAGFAFFSLTYVYDLGIGVAALSTALVALMLAIEVLREGEVDATETAGYAAAAGVAVGQWRLALHYLPVNGYLAGLAVLLGFLLVTGLLQAYITRSLDRRAAIDHAAIAVAGAALVIGARVAGLA